MWLLEISQSDLHLLQHLLYCHYIYHSFVRKIFKESTINNHKKESKSNDLSPRRRRPTLASWRRAPWSRGLGRSGGSSGSCSNTARTASSTRPSASGPPE